MATTIPFPKSDTLVFDPADIKAMSIALDDVCKSLELNGDEGARETVAVRIIELARAGSAARPSCATEFWPKPTGE